MKERNKVEVIAVIITTEGNRGAIILKAYSSPYQLCLSIVHYHVYNTCLINLGPIGILAIISTGITYLLHNE
jgi:hypothetical protein